MKLAFIRCFKAKDIYQQSLPPLGIGYLVSYLKSQISNLEYSYHHNLESILAAKPDVMCISSASEQFGDATQIAKTVKSELGIPIFNGGMHITSIPNVLPKWFDAGAIGEGEMVLADLIRLVIEKHLDPSNLSKVPGVCYHDGDKIAVTESRQPIKNLDELPYPDREFLGASWKVSGSTQVHMVTSRGCPYKCSFCSSGLTWNTYRYQSPNSVATEIEFLRNKYDPKEIYFFDDLFIANRPRFRKICEKLKERGLHRGVQFRSYARVDLVDEEMADLFDECNFRVIDFGFESNSPRVLEFLNKRWASPEKNQRCIDLLYPRNISIGANLIVASPPETREDFEMTYQFVKTNKHKIDRASMGPLLPLPGTPVWDYALERGKVSYDMDWSRLGVDVHQIDFNVTPYLNEQMPPEQFLELYERFHNLCMEVNMHGELRRVAMDLHRREAEVFELRAELARLKGSRFVKARDSFQKFKHAVLGSLLGG
ncbi:MAG: radical SAM protein [bacterium]